MKYWWSVLLLVAPCFSAGAEPSAAERVVVLVSLDGLAHFYFDDPKAEMPTLRQLIGEGARANMMKASNPTVTWPNHVTLVTGVHTARHGVVGNNYFDRTTAKTVNLILDPIFDKDEIVKVPTVYDVVKKQGLKTAAVNWPASRNAKTLDWTIPEVGTAELIDKYSTPTLLTELKAAGIDYDKADEWRKNKQDDVKDHMYAEVLLHILHKHRPNLALLHLINVDHVEHEFGPRSTEAYAAIKHADDQVKLIWELLKRDFPGRASLLIVSDHGFFPISQSILPNVVLRQAGLIQTEGKKVTGGSVRIVVQGGAAMVYVMEKTSRAALMDRVKTAFGKVDGVAKIVTSDQFKEYGLADPKDDPHSPDMIMFAKSGYSFGDTAAGELSVIAKGAERKGTHGHDANEPDLHASFVAWGWGIKPGARIGNIENISVAPTAAQLLGVAMPSADGKVLTDALK